MKIRQSQSFFCGIKKRRGLLPRKQPLSNLCNPLSGSLGLFRLGLEVKREDISRRYSIGQCRKRKDAKGSLIVFSSEKQVCQVSFDRINRYQELQTFTPFPEMRIFDASCGAFLTATEYSLPSVVTTTSPSMSVRKILSAVVNFAKFSSGSMCGCP